MDLVKLTKREIMISDNESESLRASISSQTRATNPFLSGLLSCEIPTIKSVPSGKSTAIKRKREIETPKTKITRRSQLEIYEDLKEDLKKEKCINKNILKEKKALSDQLKGLFCHLY